MLNIILLCPNTSYKHEFKSAIYIEPHWIYRIMYYLYEHTFMATTLLLYLNLLSALTMTHDSNGNHVDMETKAQSIITIIYQLIATAFIVAALG